MLDARLADVRTPEIERFELVELGDVSERTIGETVLFDAQVHDSMNASEVPSCGASSRRFQKYGGAQREPRRFELVKRAAKAADPSELPVTERAIVARRLLTIVSSQGERRRTRRGEARGREMRSMLIAEREGFEGLLPSRGEAE